MSKTVDIILPCYNSTTPWYKELQLFYESAIRFECKLQFIVVNDGSTIGNLPKQIEELKSKSIPLTFVSYPKNKGKGYALRQGVKASTADFIAYTDIDFPFTNESMAKVLQVLLTGDYDVVAGYREEAYYQNKMSGFRKQLSRLFRFFLKRVLKLPITDTQCGLKAFNKKGREKFLQTSINRYLFDFEFIYSACKDRGIRIQTVPVQLKENVVFSKMRFKILIQESFNLLSILLFKRT